MFSNVIPLECGFKESAWGKPGASSLVGRLKGILDHKKLCAELWMGTHPSVPSKALLSTGQVLLSELIKSAPVEALGDFAFKKFGPSLPFLFKVLSIGSPLSIQAHPDKELAKKLHAKDPKNYPDENHKPEIAIAITPFVFLAGFVSLAKLRSVFEKYEELAAIVAIDLRLKILKGTLSKAEEELAMKEVFASFIKCEKGRFAKTTTRIAERLEKSNVHTPEEDRFFKAFKLFGAEDVGLVSFFLLNLCTRVPGEAVFVGPNVLHAHLEGDVIECMVNSDNVVRGGLTPKFQDKKTLLSMLDYTATAPKVILASTEEGVSGKLSYRTPAEEFSIDCFLKRRLPYDVKVKSAEILLVLDGKGVLNVGTCTNPFVAGNVFFVPASLRGYSLELNEGMVYRAVVPSRSA